MFDRVAECREEEQGRADEQPAGGLLQAPAERHSNPLHPPPIGTWVIDPAQSSVSLTWRKLRLWTVTGRLHCLGVVHLDDLPPVGVIRFEQPSGLPVLTVALDDRQHRLWTLRSESLDILPSGTWRVMATLTGTGAAGLVELRLEVDPEASSPDRLALRGHGCWSDAPSASPGQPRPARHGSGSTWTCTPGE